MLRNISYKQKLKWLGIAFLLFMVICYEFSINKTVQEYRIYKINHIQTEESNESFTSLGALKARDEMLTKVFSKFQLDTLQSEKNLLLVTSLYCNENNLILKEYRPYSQSKKDSINMLTRIVTIEGPFITCIRLIRSLETNENVGKVSSVDFKSFKDPQDKKIKLNCTLFIQNTITNFDQKN